MACAAAILVAVLSARTDAAPGDSRAILVLSEKRMHDQPVLRDVLGLAQLRQRCSVNEALRESSERHALRFVDASDWWAHSVALAQVRDGQAAALEALRGDEIAKVADVRVRRLNANVAWARVASDLVLAGAHVPTLERSIAGARNHEPSASADLRFQQAAGLRESDLVRRLALLPDPGAPGTLYYLAAGDGVLLIDAVADLDKIWGTNLAQVVAPYERALGMLGRVRAARVEIWRDGQDVAGRLTWVAPSDGAAQRTQMAFALAKQLGRLAAAAAVQAGSMGQSDADILGQVLDSLESEATGDIVHVEARIAAAALGWR
jgi:hypothetical protein